ncbi:putative immune-type receptor 13 isoform 1 precursor [Silurus asotus]|uniref:Immune-type receptor 13 isoform 1 n=1 Tax=Silurus asotus TaxID=30991 RepID=A0AAD5AZ14_SILAS|nr:putative immune-type receptor 13 isoform 1 precursor [Silurus asotus]
MDKPKFKVSVLQSSVSDSVPAGASVTLQCSVLSESRAAELQVLWFRAAPSQSHPQIIYTHHNSSLQCESSTHTCVYNLSKNIFSLNDAGTYYCAVVLCGKIIFGNGTRVQMEDCATTSYPVVMCLGAMLVMCVILISVQTVLLCKRKNSQQYGNRIQHGAAKNIENSNSQDPGAVELTYTALHFNDRKTKISVQSAHFPRPSFLSVKSGQSVSLNCPFEDIRRTESVVWYKQIFGEMPQKVGEQLAFKDFIIFSEFKTSGFAMEKTASGFTLTIQHVIKKHGGLYYCEKCTVENITLSSGMFLTVTDDDEDVSVSVFQSSVSDSVPAGASVTLQCSVLSESRAAELQVLWFRAAPSQSHPQIIYTHHNSSLQCESSTNTCVYNLSKNIFSLSDTGTYYCAVVLCGKIIFGNGTRVQLEKAMKIQQDHQS